MQTHDRQPALDGIRDRRVALVAPRRGERQWLDHEHLPHRLVVDRTAKATATDASDLPQTERRILGLQVDDGPANLGRQPPAIGLGRWRKLSEEAPHPPLGKPGRFTAQRAFRHAGRPGAGRGRLPEEHDRAQQFVGFLFG